jgi:phage host-nuclease inhibitor protein Gam
MINKYVELHEKLLNLLFEYHNYHIRFMEKPTMYTQQDVIKTIMKLGKLVREIKKNNVELRKEMSIKVKEKNKLAALKKEAKKLRKQQNVNNK